MLMPMWVVLLIVWAIGIPVVYVVMDKVDNGWMLRWQWSEKNIARSRKDYRSERAWVSLGSWFLLVGVIRFEIEDRRRYAKHEAIAADLEFLRQHIERTWK